jgi:hypothetical protein
MSTSICRVEQAFPVNYEAARQALAECVLVDECKEWKDRAAAIASYAAQKRDKSLLDKATRIRARATRRLGELLEQVPREKRRDLGVTASERAQAKAVASVPHKKFEAHVERTPPTPISKLQRMGSGPVDFDASAKIWIAAERLRKNVRDFPVDVLKRDISQATPEQKRALRAALAPVVEWLDVIAQGLKL